MAVARFDVYLVSLDPTVGAEIRKTRPCLVVSPDQSNRTLRTVLVAPLTSGGRPYPTRVACDFGGHHSMIAIDQMRAVDIRRLVRRLGTIDEATADVVLRVLAATFAR